MSLAMTLLAFVVGFALFFLAEGLVRWLKRRRNR
jgi:predicted PurR-regulated permease PerM